ncbi:hypothetical protein ACQPW3_25410 [Actinosynnema sp. CA-248983]
MAGALAKVGEHERAAGIAHRLTDPTDRARTLLDVARSASGAGNLDLARRLTDDAERHTPDITDEHDRARHMADLARTAAAARLPDHAARIADDITDPHRRIKVLTAVATTMAATGDQDHAAPVARLIPDPYDRARALVEVTGALVAAGHLDEAHHLPANAATTAYKGSDTAHKALTLARLLGALTAADHVRADRLSAAVAEVVGDEGLTPSRTLAEVIEGLAAGGDERRSRHLAAEAAKHAGSVRRTSSLKGLAKALAGVGAYDDLQTVIRLLTDRTGRTSAWQAVLDAVIAADDPGHAAQVVFLMPPDSRRVGTLTRLAETLAAQGDHLQARRIATEAARILDLMADHATRASGLAAVARTLALAGDHPRAHRAADQAADSARAKSEPDKRAAALADLATALSTAGDHDHARRLAHEAAEIARHTTRPDRKVMALASLAPVAHLCEVDRLLGEVLTTVAWPTLLPILPRLQPQALIEIADELDQA